MKDKLIIFITIWLIVCLIGLVACYFMGGITTGSYYNGLINCGIWLTLLNIYADKEQNMKKFIMYDINRNEKIGEAYDEYMCKDMLDMFWDHGIDNIQIQQVKINTERTE